MSIRYEDDCVVCDDDALTVRGYYFPFGDRRIPYAAIRGVRERRIGTFTGKWRIWGTGDLRHWFHLDPRRPLKDRAIVLLVGAWVRPVITPDDPQTVLSILRERTRG